ncbi:MAG: lipid-binding protein [Bacteroidota bacterium]
MKNILYILIAACVLYSCATEDIDPGGAANNELSGEWFVTYDHSVYGADPFSFGITRLLTSTTADESATEMIIDDENNAYEFRVKAKMDISSMTFGSSDTLVSYTDDYNIKVLIRNGQIYKDAVTTEAGVMTDSIYFEVWFEDLELYTGIANDNLLVSGYRRTGFTDDEH